MAYIKVALVEADEFQSISKTLKRKVSQNSCQAGCSNQTRSFDLNELNLGRAIRVREFKYLKAVLKYQL